VGSNKSTQVNVRLICATNQNLKQMVIDKTFREDLFYRINTLIIESPPLRERGNDVILLANTFLNELSKKYNKKGIKFSSNSIQKILQHNWPGNIRELEHSVERAILLCQSEVINPEDFFPAGVSVRLESNKLKKLDDIEKEAIVNAINSQKGNLTKAAAELGISRSTLYLKIEKYGI
jgi:transcriptional regulator with PAS, ATPase and Fis domain